MIGVICSSWREASAIARGLAETERLTDGPFRLMRGVIAATSGSESPEEVLILATGGGWKAAYTGTRLLYRRGIDQLLVFTRAATAPEFMEYEGIQPGDVLTAEALFDGRGLDPLLQILPDSAGELPVELKPLVKKDPLAGKLEGGFAVATLNRRLNSPYLANRLFRYWGCGLFDQDCLGAVEAAQDEGKTLSSGQVEVIELASSSVFPGTSEEIRPDLEDWLENLLVPQE